MSPGLDCGAKRKGLSRRCGDRLPHSFSFTPEISSRPHHGHHGCHYRGFFAGSPGCTSPRGTYARSPARFVE